MFNSIRVISKSKPNTFVNLKNGNWYYNYDIQSQTITLPPLEGEEDEREEVLYNFVQVRVYGKPELYKCIEAILKKYKNEDGVSMYEASSLGLEQGDQYEDIVHKVKVDFGLAEEVSPLDRAKKEVLKKIDAYDQSSNVNSFSLNGIQVWLSKDTRIGLMNSLTIEKNAGKEESTLWFNNICITINCDAAIQMLSALELYALSCYNITAEHKVTVQNLTTLDEVMSYDFTIGYPEKLDFTI